MCKFFYSIFLQFSFEPKKKINQTQNETLKTLPSSSLYTFSLCHILPFFLHVYILFLSTPRPTDEIMKIMMKNLFIFHVLYFPSCFKIFVAYRKLCQHKNYDNYVVSKFMCNFFFIFHSSVLLVFILTLYVATF